MGLPTAAHFPAAPRTEQNLELHLLAHLSCWWNSQHQCNRRIQFEPERQRNKNIDTRKTNATSTRLQDSNMEANDKAYPFGVTKQKQKKAIINYNTNLK